jgi:lipoate-protein ligase A
VLGAELSAPPLGAAGQMALDEAVLVSSPADSLILRVYRWAGRDCTFGFSRPYAEAAAACAGRGWTGARPVRRATGGGIVFHDGDLTFSLVFPWDRAMAPGEVYSDVHRGVHRALKSRGVETLLHDPSDKPAGAAAACFARAEPLDLTDASGRKVLGGALRKKGGRGLYQGSLRPEGLGLSMEKLAAAVVEGAVLEFGARPETGLREAWLALGRSLEARYASDEWNQRR